MSCGKFGGPGPARPASLRSALLGQAHDVALRVGDQREGHAGHVLGLLNHPAAEFPGPAHGAVDVIDGDEEGDQIAPALQRADRRVQSAGHAGVDERVAGDRALVRIGPSEQVCEELAGGVGVCRPDLSVHDWMRHLLLPRWWPKGAEAAPSCPHHERDHAGSDMVRSASAMRRGLSMRSIAVIFAPVIVNATRVTGLLSAAVIMPTAPLIRAGKVSWAIRVKGNAR